MTMHLLGPAYTTNNTRKSKVKITKTKLAIWEKDRKEYNALMKRCKSAPVTMDEYIDIIHGKSKKTKKTFTTLVLGESEFSRQSREHREKYPSLDTFTGNTGKKDPMKYTGTLIKGIATMHKSNAVPVINEEQMQEISRMRRG